MVDGGSIFLMAAYGVFLFYVYTRNDIGDLNCAVVSLKFLATATLVTCLAVCLCFAWFQPTSKLY